jgi:cytochrome c peroxidase
MSSQLIRPQPQPLVTIAVADIRLHARMLTGRTRELEASIRVLDSHNRASIVDAREALKNCRYQYKSMEYFLEYFFKSSAHVYNGPAKIEVEEPELEYEEPIGFQVIESLLYQKITPDIQHQLLEQVNAVKTSAEDIPSLFYQFKATDQQVTESIRQELIRIEVLNITGYDAPLLKSGMKESAAALNAIGRVLTEKNDPAVNRLVQSGINYLESHSDFDRFDRLYFITTFITPLQYRLGYNLFDPEFLKVDSFYKQPVTSNPGMIALGKRLFFEKAISGNGQRSCASCHQPEKYFTDGLAKSSPLSGHGTIPRNTPTLFYAAYQYSQDWDGKARSIEEQVVNVMHNKDEMNADSATVVQKLMQSQEYSLLFRRGFASQPAVSVNHLAIAIAAYLRTLAPFNSAFDRYVRGNKDALSTSQIKGFNLFMGKAQCGTCHFAPLFNGLTPPDFKTTEYEVLGVPLTGDLNHPEADPDLGRYSSYPSIYYRSAFKTPTVRNIAKTAPYMHNGSFHSLETVLEFYNKGGGLGIGLNVPSQTLPSAELKLNKKEITQIISFLNALTDHY